MFPVGYELYDDNVPRPSGDLTITFKRTRQQSNAAKNIEHGPRRSEFARGRSASWPRRRRDASAEDPRRSRGVAATRPRTIRVVAATPPQVPFEEVEEQNDIVNGEAVLSCEASDLRSVDGYFTAKLPDVLAPVDVLNCAARDDQPRPFASPLLASGRQQLAAAAEAAAATAPGGDDVDPDVAAIAAMFGAGGVTV